MANTEKVRLNKYLSQAGICSRREADVLIEGGKVSVNGKIADPGMRVNDLDKITVEDKPVGHREKKVVLAPLISKHFAFRDYLEAYRYIDENPDHDP